MKRLKKFLGYSLLVILLYVVYVMASTGYFRSIENTFDGEIIKKIEVEGAEDMMLILENGYALVSASPRKDDLAVQEKEGGLYLTNLNTNDYLTKEVTTDFDKPFAPHGISMHKKDSTYTVMAVNHTLKGHMTINMRKE